MSSQTYDKGLGVKFHQDLPVKPSREKVAPQGFWKRKLVEFCKRTDLHGYKYIVMGGLNVFERRCWALAVLLSTISALYFVVTAYKWYARNPIVTVIESTQGPIWDIPFPAVTICDLNVISKKAARAFADNVTLPPQVTADFVFKTVRLAPLFHSSFITTVEQKQQLQILQDVLDLNKISMETFFRTLSPAKSCSQLLQRCMWKNTIYSCEKLFRPVFTMINLCCTFNYYAVQEVIQDQLFPHSSPRRVASCGYQTALTVLLKTSLDDYYSSMIPSQGVLVYIDSAFNLPNMDSPVRLVNPTTEVLIALSPERTYTTSGIRSFRPEQRECYYNDEVQVGNFRQYSLHNCISFHKKEVIKRMCECIPFFFPMKAYSETGSSLKLAILLRTDTGSEHFRICNFDDLNCLENALKHKSDDNFTIQDNGKTYTCLPECEHYDYPIEVAMGKLATHLKLTGLTFFNNVDLANHSLLNVFFNDLVSTRFRRDVYFNWQNFTAAFGGLLSLMLGFTLISGFDLVFFFTLRLIYNSRSERKEKRKKKQQFDEVEKKVNNWVEKTEYNRKISEQNLRLWKSKKTLPSRY